MTVQERKYRLFNEVLPALPSDRPIYWLQRETSGESSELLELLPTRPYFKLSCAMNVYDKVTILEYWPEHDHRFIVVKACDLKPIVRRPRRAVKVE